MINIEDLEKIIQVVDKYDISHFEFEHEKSKVVIEKQVSAKLTVKEATEVQTNLIDSEYLQSGYKGNKNTNTTENKAESKNINETNIEKGYIKANFAGTFYSRKETNEPEFVKLYDEVKSNTIVGLLEVMKLFNEVEAGVEGRIVDILVKDGEFVEYGQPLFEVEVGEKYV